MADRVVKVTLRGNVDDLVRAFHRGSAAARTFSSNLESTDSRLSNVVQTAAAIAPALVPIGAAAVPAIAALSGGLAAAATAGGVAVLAFQGVGDALNALNTYQLEPSAANFEAMQEAMRGLSEEGQDFVRFLQDIRPELEGLQDAAQAGLFPGLQVGITELLELLPTFENLIGNTAEAMGGLAAEAGDALNDPQWDAFFDFLANEAPGTLTTFARIIGNVASGFAGLLMAFDPLADSFENGLLRMSQQYAEFGQTVDDSPQFAEFIGYIRENGPSVVATFGEIAEAIVAIIVAAAPVGEAVLPVIRVLAEVLERIAESPVGPVLIGAAAGVAALSRAVALYKAANGTALAAMLGTVGTNGRKANVGARLAAGGIGILALSFTDLDEQLGLSATATGALAGSIAGPLGAAVGAGLGFLWDMKERLTAFTMESDEAQAKAASFTATLHEQTGAITANTQRWIANELATSGVLDEVDRLNEAAGRQVISYGEVTDAVLMGGDAYSALDDKLVGLTTTYTGTLAGGQRAVPIHNEESKAARGLRDSIGHLTTERQEDIASKKRDVEQSKQVTAAVKQVTRSTKNETQAILENIRAHNRRADQLLASMNAEIRFEQAMDDANKEAKEGKRTLDLNTQAGRDNMSALNDLAASWNDLTPAQQKARGSSERARRQFIDTAIEMGASREQARRLANQLLDIPEEVKTKAKTNTGQAERDIERVAAKLNQLDGKTARTTVTNTTIERLIRYEQLNVQQAGGIQRAAGGIVPGYSPSPTADNIPAMLTAREYVEPVASVDYYGVGLFDALRRRAIPKESLPAFGDGGQVGAADVRQSVQHYAGGGSVAAPVVQRPQQGGEPRPIIVYDRSQNPVRTAKEVARIDAFAGGG